MIKRFCDWCGREVRSPAEGRALINHPLAVDGMPVIYTDQENPYLMECFELCADGPDSCWEQAARVLKLVREDIGVRA